MTDNKQIAKDKFKEIVTADIDTMFGQTLSEEDVDSAIRQEIGTILQEGTVLNNITADVMADTTESLKVLQGMEKDVADLIRLDEIREDLQKAA